MRAINASVYVAPVRGVLSHGYHGNCTAPIKVLDYYYYYYYYYYCCRGDGLAWWLERWTRDPKDQGSNPVRSPRFFGEFFQVKNVVLTRCRCALQPLCVYAHTRMITYARHVKDLVVHVRVQWITETQKDPACTLLTG